MLSGITLIPALLFTVTGFTRILIVLGFVRQGLGTMTARQCSTVVRADLERGSSR